MEASDEDMKLPKYWENLGDAPVPEHIFNSGSRKFRYIRARCVKCGRETVIRKHTFSSTTPCVCVNLAVQKRKMGAFMRWATGKV